MKTLSEGQVSFEEAEARAADLADELEELLAEQAEVQRQGMRLYRKIVKLREADGLLKSQIKEVRRELARLEQRGAA